MYDKFLKILPVLNYSTDTPYEEFEKDLQDIGMNFVVFNENSKSFIKKYGEEIIIKEIKKHSQYINTNDVKDIIENCLE